MNNSMFKKFANLFYPKSIVLIGASRTPGKLGFELLYNLTKLGFTGDVYPINPHAKTILGKKVYNSIASIQEGNLDLAVIAVKAPIVIDAIKQCIKKGIKNFVIISAGFKEAGEEGKKIENKLIEIIKENDLKVIGPNCLGIINTSIALNASFAEGMPKKGKVSLISQSGAIAVAINDWAMQKNLGFSKIVSLGNKSGFNENDCLEYLYEDKETEVILIYAENFSDGEKFLKTAAKVSLKKPIILFKSGVSEKGKAAVFSHTGTLAGSDEVVNIALEKCGVIRAETIEDFFDFALAFSMQPLPKNNKIAIVTNAGGLGVISTDLIDRSQLLEIAHFSENTKKLLSKSLPENANKNNPVDIIGDALADRYQFAIRTILENEDVGFLLTLLTPQVMTQKEDTAGYIIDFKEEFYKTTFFTSFVGGKNIEYAVSKLEDGGVVNFSYPSQATKAMEAMIFLVNWRKKYKGLIFEGKTSDKKNFKLKKSGIFFGLKDQNKQLTQEEISNLFEKYGLNYEKITILKNEKNIDAINISYPIVLKIFSEKSSHKSDIGGVVLGIKNTTELKKIFNKITDEMNTKLGKNNFEIGIQKMCNKGNEFIIGMKRDPSFGPVIMFGIGGIFVEIIKDVSLRIAPISKNESFEMINELKSSKLIKGFRGQKPLDENYISKVICTLSQIVIDFPEILEIDINPLIVYAKGKQAALVDARIILK